MAAVNPSNLYALLNLAWRTVVHFLTYPFRQRRGLPAMREDFAIGPVPPPEALRCVGCGECARILPAAPSLILRLGREAADAPFASTAALEPHAAAITAMCPYQCDVTALIRLTRA